MGILIDRLAICGLANFLRANVVSYKFRYVLSTTEARITSATVQIFIVLIEARIRADA